MVKRISELQSASTAKILQETINGGSAKLRNQLMDHLKTPQERRDRWYSKVKPRYLCVRDIAVETENLDNGERENKNQQHHQRERGLSYVNGIPFKSIHHPKMKEHIKEQFKINGFCVFTKVLSLDECNHGLDLVWDFIEAASAAERYITMSKNNATATNGDDNGDDNRVTDADDDDDDDDSLSRSIFSLPPPIQRDNPTTHHETEYSPRQAFGILPFYGSGHTQFMWYLRTRPSIQTVFTSLHNAILGNYDDVISCNSTIQTPKAGTGEDLATSLDGMIAWIEEEEEEEEEEDQHSKLKAQQDTGTDSGWFHIDQNPITKPKYESVQGLVNLLPVTKATGGNVLVRKSHLFFPDHYCCQNDKNIENQRSKEIPSLFYADRLKEIDGDDWLEIDPYDTELLDPDNVIACMLNPGDVLIWDSRLVHCSYPACNDDIEYNSESQCEEIPFESGSGNVGAECDISSSLSNRRSLTRVAGLINMTTKSRVSDEIRCQRKDAINRCRTLTHWVNKAAPLGEERTQEVQIERKCIEFIKELQTRGERKILLSYDDLTVEQQRLV